MFEEHVFLSVFLQCWDVEGVVFLNFDSFKALHLPPKLLNPFVGHAVRPFQFACFQIVLTWMKVPGWSVDWLQLECLQRIPKVTRVAGN